MKQQITQVLQYYKIQKEDEKYYVQIFDENITDEKFEVNLVDNLKINKEKSSGVLNVEKDQSLIEKILTFMFMG